MLKKIPRPYKIAALVVALAILAFVAAMLSLSAYVKTESEDFVFGVDDEIQGKYDCILVLGAGLKKDGTPSNMLEDRLRRAYSLYESGVSDKILVSGDNGRISYNEPVAMAKYLVLNMGVPEEDVVIDYAGFSTYDSLYRARDIFCAERVVVVTQEYHLYRAVYTAQRLGLFAVGASSDYHIYSGQENRDVREIAARAKDFFSCIFMPEPKYLGEKIPIKQEN